MTNRWGAWYLCLLTVNVGALTDPGERPNALACTDAGVYASTLTLLAYLFDHADSL